MDGPQRLVVAAGAVAAVAVVVIGVVAVLPRLSDTSGAGLRASLISASVRMFEAAPLTGAGPGAWAPERIAFTDASEIDYYIPHAHNVPAQTLAEFGLVGVVAGVVVVALCCGSIGPVSRHGAGRRDGLASPRCSPCAYITGQQLVDAWIHQPAILFALALPIARLDADASAAAIHAGARPRTSAARRTSRSR